MVDAENELWGTEILFHGIATDGQHFSQQL
jgi:hypothetical protein